MASAGNTIKQPAVRTARSAWGRNLLTFLMVFGPGLIVMEADNDAGAVATYVQAGAQYGVHLLWLVIVLLPITYFIQEMVARLGIATGQGHAALIYNRFGKWWGRFSLVDLLTVNFLTLVTEFAAIAMVVDRLGIPVYLAVPLAAVGLIAVGLSGGYRRWERIAIVLCLLDCAWLVLAVVCYPTGAGAARAALVPYAPPGGITLDFVYLAMAIVGTTIAPWQLFFQQSCVADKRLRFADLKWARLDTFVGAVFTIIVAACMMLVGALSYKHGIPFTDPAQMADALIPIAGHAVRIAILLMMVNASVLGTMAISLASSWAYGEVMGWPHSLQKKITEAPGFYAVYVACVAGAAAIVLIPRAPLQTIIISVQVLAGLMLPPAVVFLQIMLSDKQFMGQFANTRWNNIVNWTIVVLLFALSAVLTVQVLAPELLHWH